MTRTIVALYDRAEDARRAVDDLIGAGVPRGSVSLVASHPGRRDAGAGTGDTAIDADRDTGSGTMVGATLGGVGGAMVAMAALAIPGVGAAVAVGPIAAGLLGAGAGAVAGGLIGSLTGFGVPEHEAHAYTEGVERGGTLLIVHADGADADRVTEVLARHPPADVRAPGGGEGNRGKDALAGRGADWRTAAWAPFDQSAGPMEVPAPQEQASYGDDPSRGAHPVAHAGEGSGADWRTVGEAPFDQSAGPVTDGPVSDGKGRPQGAGERSAGDPAAGRERERKMDDSDVGQPGTSPGTRGGATAFGGIEREAAKTGTKTGVK